MAAGGDSGTSVAEPDTKEKGKSKGPKAQKQAPAGGLGHCRVHDKIYPYRVEAGSPRSPRTDLVQPQAQA